MKPAPDHLLSIDRPSHHDYPSHTRIEHQPNHLPSLYYDRSHYHQKHSENNSRAIQSMLDQATTDRLEEKERAQRHEERMQRLENLSEGLINLTVSIDEDLPSNSNKRSIGPSSIKIDRSSPGINRILTVTITKIRLSSESWLDQLSKSAATALWKM
jgi:hypothetical protein